MQETKLDFMKKKKLEKKKYLRMNKEGKDNPGTQTHNARTRTHTRTHKNTHSQTHNQSHTLNHSLTTANEDDPWGAISIILMAALLGCRTRF